MSIDGNWIRKNETREFEERIFVEMEQQKQEYYDKKSRFNEMIKTGMDRVLAYQIIYGISNEDAKRIVADETYQNLIGCQIPDEVARKIAYENEENNSKTR